MIFNSRQISCFLTHLLPTHLLPFKCFPPSQMNQYQFNALHNLSGLNGTILSYRARNLLNVSQRTDQTTGHGSMNRLYDLPIDVLVSLPPYLHSFQDIKILASVSRVFHNIFGRELYKECRRRLDFLPLFICAMYGDIKLLRYFLKYDQPMDAIWTDKEIP